MKENARKQYDQLQQEIKELYDTIKEKSRQANELFCNNVLWEDIEKLKDYAGKDLWHIEIYYKVVGESQIEKDYLSGDILEVEEDGKLYYSDYDDGIIEWCENNNCYLWHKHYRTKEIELLGFCDLEIDD